MLSSCASSLAAALIWAVGVQAAGAAVRSVPLRTHSLTTPYLDSDMQSRWWEFGGDTIVRADQYIRLTPDKPSKSGWVFSRIPLTATNWEIEVEFKIHGAGSLHGDGMAMWITRQRGQPGKVFGHVDNFEGLGVFIDTYKNNRPGTTFPYVMAMVGDGKMPYDQANDGKANEFAGCSARGMRNAQVPTRLRLTYYQEKSLKLDLHYKGDEESWINCFETNSPPSLPSVSYLGFSADTGELSDNFDIIVVQARNLWATNEAGSGSQQKGGSGMGQYAGYSDGKVRGSWPWFFVKCFLFVGLCVGGYVVFTAYRASSRNRHRF